jgi:hypothetical protein
MATPLVSLSGVLIKRLKKASFQAPEPRQERPGGRLNPRASRPETADNFLHCGDFMILSIF